MAPTAIEQSSQATSNGTKPTLKPTRILHRTPWTPPVAASAQGIYVTLEDGQTLIDGVGGAAVACIGNGHPEVTRALKEQVDKVAYVYNMQLSNQPAEELAKFIIDHSDGAFELCGFVSGGTEAMEGVMKLARQYFYENKQPQRKNFIARQLSFHGNSIGTLSLAMHPTRRAPYAAILDDQHFHHVSPAYAKRFQKPDETEEQYVERLRKELEDKFLELGPDTVIGFVAETVVGATTGVVAPPKGYFKAMKSVCDKYGALLILDEVMSGMGRLGTLHAWQGFGDGISPDIQAVAKGLGGGYASIGAVLMSKTVADGIRDSAGFWKHGHTYQAHPLACAASLAVQKVVLKENLLENIRVQGTYMGSLLRERLQSPNALAAPFTFDVRGRGGWWGIEFDFSCPEAAKLDFKGDHFATMVQARCMEKGLIIMGLTSGANLEGTAGDHCMLSPAYNVTREQVEKIVDLFVEGPSSEPKALRSSARVKAAKQKEKEKELHSAEQASSSVVPSKRTREPVLAKGKGKEVSEDHTRSSKRYAYPHYLHETLHNSMSNRARRAAYSASPALTIRENIRDAKGKKRAQPESHSEEEENAASSSAATATTKRTRTTSNYSLRSRTEVQSSSDMTKKSRPATGKGKAATKSKAMAAAASSSNREEGDIDMMDTECIANELSQPNEKHDERDERSRAEESVEEVPDDDEGDDHDDGHDDESEESPRGPGGIDEASAMAIFGDYRQLGSYMMGLSNRLKTMLNNIKSTADPTTRLVTLQELSELLSISTEDTLAGSFQVESYIRELVRILGGTGGDADEGDDDEPAEVDEDAALAAALAMSTGGSPYQGDENPEAQVLACRCLANLMEALPGVAHTVVYHGAIPVLCSKLIEISYIDLAEQTLSTLEKISEEFPSSIVREGGLAALLNYLDFFSIAVQRTALQAASNCCRNVSIEHFPMIRGVWPIIRNCLGYADQRLVEYACLCVIRVVDAYFRAAPDKLEALVDLDLIRAVNLLLLPSGGSPLIAASTFTLLLRALANAARASPRITLVLLEAGIVDTLYQILTGVLPSACENGDEQGNAGDGQGLGGGLADMTVMENLAHRPKDQIEEALSLVSELMPPLPKDGVFDHKSYSEKAVSRLAKAKAKADRAAARQATNTATGVDVAQGPAESVPTSSSSAVVEDQSALDNGAADSQSVQDGDDLPPAAPTKEGSVDRTELLRSKPELVGRFMRLMVPILVDVYAASVNTPVRIKTLTGLLKAVSFLDGDELNRVFTCVPIASFASSILSARDQPPLVIGALQLVELLLSKVPAEYKPVFRREGVLHEIETLAARALNSSKSKEKEKDKISPELPSPAELMASASLPASLTIAASFPGYKKLSSLSIDPDDAITLRARAIRLKFLSGGDDTQSDDVFSALRRLVESLMNTSASEKELSSTLNELAALFASPTTSVSSFELLQSGVVDALLHLMTDEGWTVGVSQRHEMLFSAFTTRKSRGQPIGQTPFSTFVKKLQESLTRMESFEVITVAQSADDSKRSSPSLLARQLRLRLVAADDSDIPKNLSNIVVSIHAIATFQALHDYLRPRVAGSLPSSSRLSGMLAALAASGFAPPSSSRSGLAEAPKAASVSPAAENVSKEVSVTRRRSSRLSAKQSVTAEAATTAAAEVQAPADGEKNEAVPSSAAPESAEGSSSALTTSSGGTVVHEPEFEADFTDDEVDVDAEVLEDEDHVDNPDADKTVTVSVGDDGSKVEAQTPDGTRVPTPAPSKGRGALSTSKGPSTPGASYAAALKSKPTDWHLEFFMDDHKLPLDLTIYGAIHQHELRKKSGPVLSPSMIWQGVYTIKFKKVSGPASASDSRTDELGTRSRSPGPLSSLPEDAPHGKILRLLRVLYKLNAQEADRVSSLGIQRVLPESSFVNNKLTAKLTRQLEEPMIVASSCLPDWALDLPQHFPFLFPFATRYNFLQSTSFGYARLILKWQSQQTRGQDSSRRDDGVGFLGRLQRQKVRISRQHILESAVKVFELYGSSSSILEVEYFEEVGTGLGPTLEFYSLVSKEFARKDLKIWRDADPLLSGPYVHHPLGLFPAPISPSSIANDGGQKRTHIFRVIGQFVAKAMLDSRIIDLSFNKTFLKLILGEEVPLTVENLRRVDPDLATSLAQIQGLALASSQNDKILRKLGVVGDVTVEDLSLDFTIPGYDIELKPGGRDIAVTSQNVDEYVYQVLDAIIGKGAQLQAKAFREGFSKVFPIADLQAFTTDELVMLFGNAEEDWSLETLSEALKADHGFNVESRAIRDLLEIMSEFDAPTRRSYLQFITGSPRLPIGGFRGLNPPLTVVRKPHEAPLAADDYLPSVMTCVNYLKLPEYSSKAVMREKLQIAMKEGIGSFHLS
ncbi:uncharacterized protein LAESUDRAFT_736512 [Laetiporus sulphureus 93-53]|uniref:HECT-type E3 ubiquitin transferase n=1 Tax=Laetiporus sulphureus 93-53 TaxID=1314785 RepID=A0A165EKS5_9APHY|nr:uncharacterized protein LAESUDRAFT_736512 [Laetiporus sulphureus 93-53]KZT07265.1 hypothetical protein LAESUDRAFT_736512 [Laetiporus sulphureus 93-53]